MVYIIGHTRKEFLVAGTLLPKMSYNEEELARGRKTVLTLSDDEWAKLREVDAVKELLAQHSIEALDEAPVDKFSTNSDLQAALQQSEDARVALQAKYEQLQEEALQTIQKLQDEIKQLKDEQ